MHTHPHVHTHTSLRCKSNHANLDMYISAFRCIYVYIYLHSNVYIHTCINIWYLSPFLPRSLSCSSSLSLFLARVLFLSLSRFLFLSAFSPSLSLFLSCISIPYSVSRAENPLIFPWKKIWIWGVEEICGHGQDRIEKFKSIDFGAENVARKKIFATIYAPQSSATIHALHVELFVVFLHMSRIWGGEKLRPRRRQN